MAERPALLWFNDWAGRNSTPVFVVGETPKRYRIKALRRMRLAGRNRWLMPGATALVPRGAIQLAQCCYKPIMDGDPERWEYRCCEKFEPLSKEQQVQP